MDHYPVPESVYNWLRFEKLKSLNNDQFWFIALIIQKTIFCLSRDESPVVYIRAKEYESLFKKISIRALGAEEVFKKREYLNKGGHPDSYKSWFKHPDPLFHAHAYSAGEECRAYYLESWWTRNYFKKLQSAIVNEKTPNYVDLFTGKRVTKSKIYYQTSGYERAYNQKLIRDAIDLIKPRPVNIHAVREYLAGIEVDGRNYKRYACDFSSWVYLHTKGLEPLDPKKGIYLYQPEYAIQKAGRLTELGIGFQSCSREMKKASTQGIDDIYNYDLKDSQLNGLRTQMKLFGLKSDWLEKYVSDRKYRSIYASKIGVSEDVWKKCLLMVVMGSSTNNYLYEDDDEKRCYSDLFLTLREGLNEKARKNHTEQEVDAVRLAFLAEIDGLLAPMKSWRRKLRTGYLRLGQDYAYKRHGACQLKNKLGISYNTKEHDPPELTSYMLQGQEAAFIHNLTLLSSKYGFQVVGNEHDGLVTIGKIPDAAVEEVKTLLNIEEFILEEKSDFGVPSTH